MDKLVSIIVPVYKAEKFLDECIGSMVAQTYRNIEIILVDDGSPDNCPAICDAWAEKDPRVRVIHKANAGVSAARNSGIEAAKGEYFYFVDSDDYIHADLCRLAVEALEKTGADAVAFGLKRITEEGEIYTDEPAPERIMDREAAMIALAKNDVRSSVWSKVYKRKVWEGRQFPAGKVFEDVAITYKLMLDMDCICSIPDTLYYYRSREGSIVAVITESTLRDLYRMQKQRYDDILPVYPKAAEIFFVDLVRSAKAYVDHALCHGGDHPILEETETFLRENKSRILKFCGSELKLYLLLPGLYRLYRRIRPVK